MSAGSRQLVYLYVGSTDVGADLAFYRDRLGGVLVWRSEGFGAEVAAVRLGDGPLVLLADHREAPSVLPIWAVDDLDVEVTRLRAAGWDGDTRRVEVPDGPCVILVDPSGNEVAFLERVRPGVMERRPDTVHLMSDLGYFGPRSVSWHVHREVTVLFGGARAVLMQAAHPLVIAGARETGFYERNPWRRLQRTLVLTYTITFGTKAEAQAAADRINEVHQRIRGVDEVTGLPYDGLDPELLLYVHACLVDSALLFEEHTVGRLDDAGRQRFHEEQMLAAEMVRIPREMIPPTVPELRAHLQGVYDSGILHVGDSARKVAALFDDPPREAEWRPVLRGVSRLAFGTLPSELRRLYRVELGPVRRRAMDASFAATRALRPLLPARYRFIAPYQEWLRRRNGRPPGGLVERARRSAGIRPDEARSIRG